MPRIKATRFSSVIGLLLGRAVGGIELAAAAFLSGGAPAPGTVMEAPGAEPAWAMAKAEHPKSARRSERCFGDMGYFTCIVHLPLVGCKLRQRVRARQRQPFPRDLSCKHRRAGFTDRRGNPLFGIRFCEEDHAPATARSADLSRLGAVLRRGLNQFFDQRGGDAWGIGLAQLPFGAKQLCDFVPVGVRERFVDRAGNRSDLLEVAKDFLIPVDVRFKNLPIVDARLPRRTG